METLKSRCWLFSGALGKTEAGMLIRQHNQTVNVAAELLEALESVELFITQVQIAANIGRKSAAQKVAWYESQLGQLRQEVRAAIDNEGQAMRGPDL